MEYFIHQLLYLNKINTFCIACPSRLFVYRLCQKQTQPAVPFTRRSAADFNLTELSITGVIKSLIRADFASPFPGADEGAF